MTENINNLLNFIENAKTPFHGVYVISHILEKNGYMRLFEVSNFKIEAGGKYYVIRNDASIIAFQLPQHLTDNYFKIVASHLDSPTFKIKPNGILKNKNYQLLNTEVYGGPIYSTWFDRPLGIGGRIIINENNKLVSKIIDIDKKVIIPNIAIHLNREVNRGVELNPQSDTLPLFSSADSSKGLDDLTSEALSIKKEQILGSDLFLYCQDKGMTVGINDEYFTSPRIDNLECAYGTLIAFINSKATDASINVYASFNHEEVGSSSNHGANSTFLIDVISQIIANCETNYYQALAKSIFISADNAHAIHPAAESKADPTNYVEMNKGIVIKNSANLSYTTDAISTSIIKKIWQDAKIPYQEYTNRSNLRGGSTLGCISLGHLSINSVDIGLAQLAMHSANETAGCLDLDYLIKGIKAIYQTKLSYDSFNNIIIEE